MPQFSALIRSVTAEKFAEILGASGRKAREVYFHRHNIRPPKVGRGLPKAGAKNEFRTAALFDALRERDDDELAEEVLRTYLLTKRPLLVATLDHLGIAHQDGLTDSDDVKKLETLSGSDLKALVAKLKDVAAADDIALYLKFMGAPGVDEALAA
jgi:hypothetical protein